MKRLLLLGVVLFCLIVCKQDKTDYGKTIGYVKSVDSTVHLVSISCNSFQTILYLDDETIILQGWWERTDEPIDGYWRGKAEEK